MNEIRIIGGELRGRRIRFRQTGGLRPTLDAVRETLFNWLMFKVKDAKCLDAFAGSGALGIEALSRFAGSVTFLEYDKDAMITLKKNLNLLNLQDRAQILHDSATRYLFKVPAKYDLIFLDPPFKTDFLKNALKLIYENKVLNPEGLVYFEAERQLDIAPLIERKFELYRHKALGEVQFGLLSII